MGAEELWINNYTKLKDYIMKRVSDKYEAEDILQEVGIRIKKNENRIKDISNAEAWLYRIAHNLIVDYYRGNKTHSLINIEEIDKASFFNFHEYENYNKETAECLLKLVEYLPAKYKEAIIESDYKGERQNMLGRKWGLSNSGSKTRIQRARKKLKAVLFSCCEVKSDNLGNIIELNIKDNGRKKYPCINC